MAAYQSPKLLVGVRVPGGMPNLIEEWQRWIIAPVLKTDDRKRSVGSNPTSSAKFIVGCASG